MVRWNRYKYRFSTEEMVFELKGDDERFGLQDGDKLVCVNYPWDAKVTVLYRLSDGYDPECNQYNHDVKFLYFLKDGPLGENR